ncbi:alpha/beta hydrolase [Mumia sp. zg.B21]|uniref:alpha/beta fold hydrolase n=1 Tax=Mumia sp. zg.B21 TaxID=2855447 RepID=UPI001C6EEC5F|nr:alpha/beta hydrolase [Mumia sp. zg.B21]MBW9208962.1 alpha/beta hydrolase [Mumia sp. zg.B21]
MRPDDLPALHHTEHGPADGTPVLAIHGWTPDHRLMTGCCEPVFAARPRPYRRLYPDLPGMGRSSGAGVASSDDVLSCVEAYVDEQLGDSPFLLVGESYGGYLARALTARRAGQVRGLALICPVGRAVEQADRTVPRHQVLVKEIEVEPGSEFAEIAVVQTADTFERTEREVVVGVELADAEALARIRRRWVLKDDPEGGPAYEGPTLIVTGRQDSSTGYVDSWALLEHYPRATFAVLDTAGHNAQIERPELFGSLMNDWLDRVDHVGASSSA